MKNKVNYLLITALFFVCIGVISFIFEAFFYPDAFFIRKVYGVIGMVDNNEMNITFEAYSYGDKAISYINNSDFICFDDDSVTITNLAITKNKAIKNVVCYNISLDICVEEGEHFISKLILGKENENITYSIGGISLVYEEKDIFDGTVSYDNIFDKSVKFKFMNNEKNDCEYALIGMPEMIHLSKQHNYMDGCDEIEVYADYSIGEYDIYIFRPLMEIKRGNEKSYYTPGYIFINEKEMQYAQIKEYLNAKD